MSTNIETYRSGSENALLDERNQLIIAAQAGFVEAVANRLRFHAENDVSPREIFNVGAAALQGYEKNLSAESNTRHVETIGLVLAETAMKEPNRPNIDMVSDDHIGVLLESKMRESTRNPLITLLLAKGAIGYNLKKELSLHISDEAYDDFLAGLQEPVDGGQDQFEGGVSTIENNELDLSTLYSSQTLDELNEAFATHPDREKQDVLLTEAYNRVIAARVLNPKIGFEKSAEYLSALKIVLDEEEGSDEINDNEELAQLHAALDVKLIRRAEQYRDAQLFQQLGNLLSEHKLLSLPESEGYEFNSKTIQDYLQIAFREILKSAAPADITNNLESTESNKPNFAHTIGFDAKRLGINIDAEQEMKQSRRRRFEKVVIDIQSIENLDEEHPLRAIYDNIQKHPEAKEIKIEFLDVALQQLLNPKDILSMSKLAQLREYVDDPDLKDIIIYQHDIKLLRHTQMLFAAGKYRDILQILTSVKFSAEDGSEIVEAGRNIFIEAEKRFTKSLQGS